MNKNIINKIILSSEKLADKCYESLEKRSQNTSPINVDKKYYEDNQKLYVDGNDYSIVVSKKALYKSIITREMQTRVNQFGYGISGGISKCFRKFKKTLGD